MIRLRRRESELRLPWHPMAAITTAGASTTASDARPIAARATDAVKEYGKGDAMVRALDGITVAIRQEPVQRDHGTVRVGQIDVCCIASPASTG